MNRRMKKRRSCNRHSRQSFRMNVTAVAVVVCLSVGAGYLTAKYVVYPLIGASPVNLNLFDKTEDSDKEKTETDESALNDKEEITQSAVEEEEPSGYHLQFGSFKSKSAAQERLEELKNSGISAEIVNKDGAYKIIGQLFETKEKAKAALKKLDKTIDAFVTQI